MKGTAASRQSSSQAGKRSAVREPKQKKKNLPALSLAALGVVFGDIGTSPLYTLTQCFKDLHAAQIDAESVLGILSLIFWALILVVCVKYATFILRADHEGEGGILAMLALLHTKRQPKETTSPPALVLMVLAGAALLYGDGVITPAISVLSAVEGLKVAAPGAEHFVVPSALVILVGLFLLQSRGTGTVGKLFGPVMTLWFLSIAVLGVNGIAHGPQVLSALNPIAGFKFIAHHGATGFLVLGGVVLCITGVEALYADLSHFGRLPIKLSWYGLVLPALVMNYFGEGAYILSHPAQTEMPFFGLVPHVLLWPAVILATLATVIASQALISGTFTLTEQAIYMGYFPRFRIIHTARQEPGQVYVPAVNQALMIACAGVVLAFQSSEKLGGAYGLAVVGTMLSTSITFYFVLKEVWKWPKAGCMLLAGFFVLLDGSFLAGNVVKIVSGAWLPLILGALVFGIFWIWTECTCRLRRALDAWSMPLDDFRRSMKRWDDRRDGTGVFVTVRQNFVPLVGRNHWLREIARHEQVLLVNVIEEKVPYIPENQMGQIESLGNGLWRLTAFFGFMQERDIPRLLKAQPKEKIDLDWNRLVCYLPEPIFEPKGSWWRQRIERIYQFLRQNSLKLARYFCIPARHVVLVGVELDLTSGSRRSA